MSLLLVPSGSGTVSVSSASLCVHSYPASVPTRGGPVAEAGTGGRGREGAGADGAAIWRAQAMAVFAELKAQSPHAVGKSATAASCHFLSDDAHADRRSCEFVASVPKTS